MTWRERCACGAEYEVIDSRDFDLQSGFEPRVMQDWRIRHREQCKLAGYPIVDGSKAQPYYARWDPEPEEAKP